MRQRLTITLKKELLKSLDERIDGVIIRNRSHAIEQILEESLTHKIRKVLILAGGRGVKMRPFTYELPKPLIPFKSKPLLEHTLELLKKYKLDDIVISTGYLGQKIKDHFGDGSQFGVRITYSEEGKPLGTAGALRHAQPLLPAGPFLVLHGDVLIEIDLKDFIDFFLKDKTLACLALTSVRDPSDYGVAQLEGERITGFEEKPRRSKAHMVSAGVYIFDPAIFEHLPKKVPSSLETNVFPKLARSGELLGYSFSGQWFDISDPATYEKALKSWKKAEKT